MTDRHAAIAANDGASAPVSKLLVAANDNAPQVDANNDIDDWRNEEWYVDRDEINIYAGFGYGVRLRGAGSVRYGPCEDDAEHFHEMVGNDNDGDLCARFRREA